MRYEFVFSAKGKEIARECGDEELQELLKKIDSMIVKQKE